MWVIGLIFFFPADNFGVEVAIPYDTEIACQEALERLHDNPPPDKVEVTVVVECEYKAA